MGQKPGSAIILVSWIIGVDHAGADLIGFPRADKQSVGHPLPLVPAVHLAAFATCGLLLCAGLPYMQTSIFHEAGFVSH